MSDYSGQHNFISRSGPDGLHIPEKEATVSNILQIIRHATLKYCFTILNLSSSASPLLSSTHHFALISSFLSLFSSCSLDLVIVVWKQRILMRGPPVLPLLAHTLRPETTPSGTAAAISKLPIFPFLFCCCCCYLCFFFFFI